MPSNLNPAADGLRTLSGRINGDGTVTLYAVTSTVSTAVDQGADPNQLVTITDNLSYMTASDAASEQFNVLQTAAFGEVLRGVAFVPLEAPTAVAGSNQSNQVLQTIHLDGSASFAPNTPSSSLLYSWSFASTPMGSNAVLTGANTATPSFTADLPGTFVVELVVTDPNTGLQSMPSQVTVSSTYVPPTANAGMPQTTLVGKTISLNGSATELNGLLLNYTWSMDTFPAGSMASLSDIHSAMPSFTPDMAGDYTFSLIASDLFGSSAPSLVTVSVITANDYLERQIAMALNYGASIPLSQFDAPGHRQVLAQLLQDAIANFRKGHNAEAKDDLKQILIRTDGYPLRGSIDTDGAGRDWIVDPMTQTIIYQYLNNIVNPWSAQ